MSGYALGLTRPTWLVTGLEVNEYKINHAGVLDLTGFKNLSGLILRDFVCLSGIWTCN